jgi:hypothetical protein
LFAAGEDNPDLREKRSSFRDFPDRQSVVGEFVNLLHRAVEIGFDDVAVKIAHHEQGRIEQRFAVAEKLLVSLVQVLLFAFVMKMGKALIIAEKPSVAADIAKALGGFAKVQDHFESDRFVLSSAVGHLLELCLPEGVEVKRGKWSFAHLPVIPDHFDLRPIEKSEGRLKELVRLIKRKDVDRLINACDAGREGELIFRYIVQHAKAKQPIQRLWLQSMTPGSIRDGFAALRRTSPCARWPMPPSAGRNRTGWWGSTARGP